MDFKNLKSFLKWCTIINLVLLALTFIISITGLDFVYSFHDKLFQMPRESFNVVWYSFLGFYKIVWLVFNVVPYIALHIIRKE